jgi:predicted P-loop ATPase
MFNDGEQWHLDENERKAVSEAASHFTRSDPWEVAVKDAVGLRREVTVAEVMKEMGLAVERQDYGAANRVGDVLRGMGWGKRRVSTPSGWSTVWRPEGS